MAPNFSKDEIDDLLYFARTGDAEFNLLRKGLCARENVTFAGLLESAKDEMSGNGALHMASANGHESLIEGVCKLLSQPTPQNTQMLAILNGQNKAGNTALHWAALNGHLPAVKILLDHGADPTITNQKGHDAVYEAELNDRKEVVEWILKESEEMEQGLGGEDGADEEMEDGPDDINDSLAKDETTALEENVKKMDIHNP